MKHIFLLVIPFLIFFSCNNEIIAKFEITNKTYTIIDSLNISSFDYQINKNYINLKPGETKEYFLDLTDLPKVDGDYFLRFIYLDSNKKESERFGYYTNGYPLEKLIQIKISRDTIAYNSIIE
jgi:hypothetical protein